MAYKKNTSLKNTLEFWNPNYVPVNNIEFKTDTTVVLDFSELQATPSTLLHFKEDGASYVAPIGIYSPVIVGKPSIGQEVRRLSPSGISAPAMPNHDINFKGVSDSKYLNFLKVITDVSTTLNFGNENDGYRLVINHIGSDYSAFGSAVIDNQRKYISTKGFAASSYGTTEIVNRNRSIPIDGVNNTIVVGRPTVFNNAVIVAPSGRDQLAFGQTVIYNLKQFVSPQSRDNHSSYGFAYLQGGVKYVAPRGIDSLSHGKTVLVNTTATQGIAPKGISSLEISSPIVSPRIIYINGIYKSNFGAPNIRIPVLMPDGFVGSSYGLQTVWFHTRPIRPSGMLSYESGYPQVFDPTQFIQAPSLLTSAIFGDTAIKNLTSVIKINAIDDGVVTNWAIVTNANRYLQPKSIESLAIGSLSISNGTPELFPESFSSYAIGSPAIGYRIRTLSPSGFDRLVFGRPVLTKTPELIVKGHVSSKMGETTIWHKNRKIEVSAIDSAVYGKPTAWFRYRYLTPQSWQSDNFNKPELTHGLREVISKGFIRDAYGNAWISASTRRIEPKSIYQDLASNHMVGGTQTIAPQGYVATLFGTRIVPESQSVYPLGFAGQLGLAEVGLYTRYIRPAGYLTVGTQPAERWGQAKAYNLTQHIFQTFDGNSGLVPPPWSDWLLVENRNKTLRATGLSSEKFGYSQIDNNAAPLLPTGIEPPPIKIGLVSHGIRRIPIEGIEAPMLSSWAVVHNGARVISPTGLVHTKTGAPAVVNTRRYYNNIGRIDSLESGTPMIAYRIRTIDIEPRYSIAPPQIDLPAIELHTRYVTFQGIETLRYGTPSLSIHFNIIGPKWNHREKFGYPALRNVTPELLIYGHNSSEFGRAGVRTQWREVRAQGDNTSVFGALVIADTKRIIEVRGFQSLATGQKHAITQTGTNPYVTQTIWLANINDPEQGNGYGISSDDEFKSNRIPKPGLNQNVLYPNGFHNPKFGIGFIWSNNIQINGGIGTDSVSRGLSVFNKTQSIDLSGKGILSTVEVGKPRISPHTIWSVKEAPNQAVTNHDGIRGEYVGAGTGAPTSLRMGRPSIESTIRSIRSSSFVDSRYGEPRLALGLTIIQPEPFNLLRMGMPSIPFTLQTIAVRNGIGENNWGKTIVSRPPYVGPQTLKPAGINSFNTGSNAIENLIRFVNPVGRDSLSMGRSISGDTPFMWQGLRVGEQIPLIIGGDDTSSHGLTWISLRVRDIGAEGFDAFRSEYDITDFNGKMTVKNADKKLPSQTVVTAIGVEPYNAFGYQDIKLGQYYIRPDGNSDQFRKGGYHA